MVSTGDQGIKTLSYRSPEEGWPLGESFVVKPGQLAILITEEVIQMPENRIGFISVKASSKLEGLINVSGFHVDPGYWGRLKFSVYNAGSDDFVARIGEPLFMIWFSEFDRKVSDPYGPKAAHYGQTQIGSGDAQKLAKRLPSPIELDKKLGRVLFYVPIVIALLTTVLGALIVVLLRDLLG
jgi:dCTP deaminase